MEVTLYSAVVSTAVGYFLGWLFFKHVDITRFILGFSRPERMKRLGSKITLCYTEYLSWVAVEQRTVKKFKEMLVTENDIKNILYGSIRELTRNRTYYYNGYQSHFTEEGKRVVNEMLDLYAEKIDKAIKQADEERSKEMVMNALKEENK
jgi:hypothetical protein